MLDKLSFTHVLHTQLTQLCYIRIELANKELKKCADKALEKNDAKHVDLEQI